VTAAGAQPVHGATTSDRTPWAGGFLALFPLALFALVLAAPDVDRKWENQPAHFWIVLSSAVLSVGLGYAVNLAATRRRDARLLLVSLAFMASAGFLALHALATPTVLLGKNAGFELATPVGLAIAGAFAAASAWLSPPAAGWVDRHGRALTVALAAALAAWGIVSLAELAPLSGELGAEQLDGWQVSLAVAGVLLYAAAGIGYWRLYRERRNPLVLVVAMAFVLLAEAMVVVAWARNWQLSWWEWHLLMMAAFLAIAAAARSQWHEERFSSLYLDRTLAGARDVSVLFADLEGYTSFAERTEPSDVATMLNAYFGRVVPLMEDLGGEVHQLIGDAVMVVFNKDGERPDHAACAARAGLALQRAAAEVARDHPDWPRFRVGVNSGAVHAGVVGAARGHRTHAVVGDTVNVAARLEAQAPVDRVVVGGDTVRRLPPGAVVARLADLRLKGKSEPVEAYVLERLPDGDGAGRDGR
jgi:class 3 adenylate cyclase